MNPLQQTKERQAVAPNQPGFAMLIQSIDADDLVERIANAVIQRLGRAQASEEGPRLLSREEMAKRLSVSLGSLDRLVSTNAIPSVTSGSRRLFDPQRVVEALNEKGDAAK